MAVGHGHLYLASVTFGIHVIAFEPVKPISSDRQLSSLSVDIRQDEQAHLKAANQQPDTNVVFRTNAQVHGVDFHDNNVMWLQGWHRYLS